MLLRVEGGDREGAGVTHFSNRIGPFMASTRPYFLLRVEMSKNSSWLSDCMSATVCRSSSTMSDSMKAFGRPLTKSVRCSTSRAMAATPFGLIFLTSGDKGKSWKVTRCQSSTVPANRGTG